MRKFLVGSVIALTFTAYALYMRSGTSKVIRDTQDNNQNITNHSFPTSSAQKVSSTPPAPTPSPTPSLTPAPTPTPNAAPQSVSQHKNGTYNGSVEDAFYGNIQVQITINGGRLTNVVFLQYPNDRDRSIEINSRAMPILKSQAISTQSAKVDGVSGATDTSDAFVASLTTALSKARA